MLGRACAAAAAPAAAAAVGIVPVLVAALAGARTPPAAEARALAVTEKNLCIISSAAAQEACSSTESSLNLFLDRASVASAQACWSAFLSVLNFSEDVAKVGCSCKCG